MGIRSQTSPPGRRALALVAGAALAASVGSPGFAAAAAAQSAALTVTADRIEYNSLTKVVTADGHVRAEGNGAVLTADHLEGSTATQEAVAAGHVTLESTGTTATGSLLRYNFQSHVGHMEQVEGTYPPWHVAGQVIDVSPQQDVARDASITPCDPAHPAFKVTARKIVIVPNVSFTAYDASLYVAGVRVITLPVYASTVGKQSGPNLGYSSLDGLYLEYLHSFPVAGLHDDFRIRLASTSGLSAENIITDRVGDHVWILDLGRHPTINTGGTLVNLDRYSVDLEYDREQVPRMPLSVQFEAHAGVYHEPSTNVTTSRVEALLNFSTDTFQLSPTLLFSAGGQVRFDVYGTGQQRTVIEGSAALTKILNSVSSASLAYGGNSVGGATPFSFDVIGPGSAATLSYTYAFGGFVQSASTSLTYDFLGLQTILGLGVAMSITSNLAFNVSAAYNLTTQQLAEVDYAVNYRCDCITVGLVYHTFPQSPSVNYLSVMVGLNVFPGTNVTFSGTGATF